MANAVSSSVYTWKSLGVTEWILNFNAYISKYLGQYFGRFLFDYLCITGVSIGYYAK
jgi:hypothetical protein